MPSRPPLTNGSAYGRHVERSGLGSAFFDGSASSLRRAAPLSPRTASGAPKSVSPRSSWGKTAHAGLVLTSCLGVDEDYAEAGAFDNVSVISSAGTGWSVPHPTRTATDLRVAAGADAVELAWTDPDLSARYKVLRALSSPTRAAVTAPEPESSTGSETHSDEPHEPYQPPQPRPARRGEPPRSSEPAGGLTAALAVGASAAAVIGGTADAAPATFTHPGMLHAYGELNRAKVRAAAGCDPRLSRWSRRQHRPGDM